MKKPILIDDTFDLLIVAFDLLIVAAAISILVLGISCAIAILRLVAII